MVIEVRQLLGGGPASLDWNAHGIMDAMVMMVDDAVGGPSGAVTAFANSWRVTRSPSPAGAMPQLRPELSRFLRSGQGFARSRGIDSGLDIDDRFGDSAEELA
jgi:hypothetical protein